MWQVSLRRRICERHGVADQLRIHYDPSHAVLMGQDTRSIFQVLKDAGYGFLVAGFHVKGQVIDAAGLATWGYGGQTLERGEGHLHSRGAGLPGEVEEGRISPFQGRPGVLQHELQQISQAAVAGALCA